LARCKGLRGLLEVRLAALLDGTPRSEKWYEVVVCLQVHFGVGQVTMNML
jgi:hypothetical protein